jgi:hypothetical protein
MPRVGLEPTIPVFEGVKTVHALDRAATLIGFSSYSVPILNTNFLINSTVKVM